MLLRFENKKQLTTKDLMNIRSSLVEDIDSLTNRKLSLEDAISFKLFFLQTFSSFFQQDKISSLSKEEELVFNNFLKTIQNVLSLEKHSIEIPMEKTLREKIDYLYFIFEELRVKNSEQFKDTLKLLVKIFDKNRAVEQMLVEKVREF